MTPVKCAQSTALMLSALSTGVFFGTSTSLGWSTKRFTPQTYVEVQQATVRNLRPVMAPLLPASAVANVLVLGPTVRDRRSAAFALTGLGVLSQLASIALTVGIELPINARVLTWAPESPPEVWEAVRDRWHAVHLWRTAASVAGLGCLVAAAVRAPRH